MRGDETLPRGVEPASIDDELRILFVEDTPEDAEISIRELRARGLRFISARVNDKDDYLAALSEFDPSIIVSDYSMPRFDGMKALRLSMERDPSVPFIVLTGSKNEETAVQCLKAGANDYVLKSHIGRLPFAITEALERASATREKDEASRALIASELNYRALADSGQLLIWTSGADTLCTYFNKPWLEFTGRSIEEECGVGWTRGIHPDDLERYVSTYSAAFDRREKFGMEYRLRRKDGEYRWIQDEGCPRYGIGGEFLGYIGHCLDTTDRKLAEEGLRRALLEKETLLRELFHRTRNNMQVIMAILDLEAAAANDERISKIVRETSDRIMSMSLVHKKLYESNDLSSIDLRGYTDELMGMLTHDDSFPVDRVVVKTAVESLSVLIDTAVPCGLILHELVSNAIRYAYPGDSRGEIRVSIAKTLKGSIELEIADDGIGLPADFDRRKKETIGFKMIQGLVERQLGGTLSFESKRGLSCRVSFMDKKIMKRL